MEKTTRLRRYMTAIPYTVEPRTSVRVALELMRRHGIRHLPVEDANRLTGILSDWDIICRSHFEKALDLPVSELMTRDPFRIAHDASIEDAIKLMSREGVGCILVIGQDGQVSGIFTEKDAVRAFADQERNSPQFQEHMLS